MKLFTTTFVFLITLPFLFAQNFTKVNVPHLSSQLTASRSANFVDINGDGWDDIFISNGPSAGENNNLYLNNGDGTFSIIGDDPIVQDNGKSDGATFADVDNDGDLDAFVVTWYGQINFFYRNNGDGTFTYEPDIAMGNTGSHSETAAWGDYDNDGWVDLYVTNSFNNLRNLLYHNMGDGQFERITTGEWTTSPRASRSVDWVDIDGDGDTDLFVTNENNTTNDVFINESTPDSVIFNKNTNSVLAQGGRTSAGSSWGDIDNDGDLDVFIANWNGQTNQLYRNNGDGNFEAIHQNLSYNITGCSFGSAFADADNDGDLDLFVCNAFCNETRNFFYFNDGTGQFTLDENHLFNTETGWTFGCAWGDFNNDGFQDMIWANCKDENQANALYQNEGNDNNWFKLHCIGTTSNKSAIHTIVRAKATINGVPTWQMRHITAQSGYCSQNSLTVHFGLEDAEMIDSLIIEWPSGLKEIFTQVSINRTCEIIEGQANDCMLTDVEEVSNNQNRLKIYPNPVTSEQVTIEFSFEKKSKKVKLELFDIQGRKLKSHSQKLIYPETGQIQFSTSGLSTGIYQISLQSGNNILSDSLIVQ